MTNDPIHDREWITSEILEYFPPAGDMNNMLADMQSIMEKFQVRISFDLRNGPGGIPIRLSGKRRHVARCIRSIWIQPAIEVGTYERDDEDLLVESFLGDTLADHRLTTGCKLGFEGVMPKSEYYMVAGNPKIMDVSTKMTALRQASIDELWNEIKVRPDIRSWAPDGYIRDDDSVGDMHWERHWELVREEHGVDYFTEWNDRVVEEAIGLLVQRGLAPSENPNVEYDRVQNAQNYLELAFLHCPELMDAVPEIKSVDEVLPEIGHYEWVEKVLYESAFKAANNKDVFKFARFVAALHALQTKVPGE